MRETTRNRSGTALAVTGHIFDIKRFAIHDGPGIRTTVFLRGCPLDCWWCHNPESHGVGAVSAAEDGNAEAYRNRRDGCRVTVEDVVDEIAKDELFYSESSGGVTLSGGEPLTQLDFVYDLLSRCRQLGYHTAVDTCGHAPSEAFEKIYDLVDLFLYDVKLMNSRDHRKYTGLNNHLVLANLKLLAVKGGKVHVRIPMVPGITDTEHNLAAIADFLTPLDSIRRISLLPYNRLGEDKARRYGIRRHRLKLPSRQPEDLQRWAVWFAQRGYHISLGG